MLTIRALRIKKGWSQAYVSRQLGVTRTQVCDMESGKTKPSYKRLVKLLELFGRSDPRELFSEYEDEAMRESQ